MTQKYLIGSKVKVTISGEIQEVYLGWDETKRCPVLRYKIVGPNGVAMAVAEDAIEEV